MSTTRFGLVRLFLVLAKVLLIAVTLALLAAYFGSRVREAGGTVVRAAFEGQLAVASPRLVASIAWGGALGQGRAAQPHVQRSRAIMTSVDLMTASASAPRFSFSSFTASRVITAVSC